MVQYRCAVHFGTLSRLFSGGVFSSVMTATEQLFLRTLTLRRISFSRQFRVDSRISPIKAAIKNISIRIKYLKKDQGKLYDLHDIFYTFFLNILISIDSIFDFILKVY